MPSVCSRQQQSLVCCCILVHYIHNNAKHGPVSEPNYPKKASLFRPVAASTQILAFNQSPMFSIKCLLLPKGETVKNNGAIMTYLSTGGLQLWPKWLLSHALWDKVPPHTHTGTADMPIIDFGQNWSLSHLATSSFAARFGWLMSSFKFSEKP